MTAPEAGPLPCPAEDAPPALEASGVGAPRDERPQRLFALVDCSAFYCSCERVFDPSLGGVPVAVLSNNDGCIIARSQEVKDLGIPMGAPFFKHKRELAERGVRVFSSNYTLVCLAERHQSTPEASGAAGGVTCITRAAT